MGEFYMRLFSLGCVFLFLFATLEAEEQSISYNKTMSHNKNSHYIQKNMFVSRYGLRGRQGPRGFRGHRGPRGHRGRRGKKGDTGIGTQGNTGPTGPQGATGSVSANYASGDDTAIQTIPLDGQQNIAFANDQVTAVGIVHPVSGDFSQFQILNSGTYLFQWYLTFNFSSSLSTNPTLLSPRLFNLSTTTTISPVQMITVDLPDATSYTNIAGQSLVTVTAGTIMTLQISSIDLGSGGSSVNITNRTFVITQVAP